MRRRVSADVIGTVTPLGVARGPELRPHVQRSSPHAALDRRQPRPSHPARRMFEPIVVLPPWSARLVGRVGIAAQRSAAREDAPRSPRPRCVRPPSTTSSAHPPLCLRTRSPREERRTERQPPHPRRTRRVHPEGSSVLWDTSAQGQWIARQPNCRTLPESRAPPAFAYRAPPDRCPSRSRSPYEQVRETTQ